MIIKDIVTREILQGRGTPTLETTVILDNGMTASASVPSGTSVGIHEAVELRDHDQARYNGQGVLKAMYNIKTIIAKKLIGMDVRVQKDIDHTMIELDGTDNKSRLGANTMLSVSIACAKAAATAYNIPLFQYLHTLLVDQSAVPRIPIPLFTVVEGGQTGNDVIDFQEFLIVPASSKIYTDSIQIASQVYASIREIMKTNGLTTLTGFEGGFGPRVANNSEVLNLLTQAVDATNLRLGYDLFFGIDASASNYYQKQQYHIRDKLSLMSSDKVVDFYKDLLKQYRILYVEDILAEDDWEGWTMAYKAFGQDISLIGDDLIAGNPYRLQEALDKKAVSGVVINPTQRGTLLETLAVIEMSKAAGVKLIISGRSNETNDDFIADLAVAAGADYVKFGAPARGEHIAKYNRLSKIQEILKPTK